MCSRSAMIRNNQRIKGGFVGEETRCIDMSTYGVEEFRRILRIQLNRHLLYVADSGCGVSWGIRVSIY